MRAARGAALPDTTCARGERVERGNLVRGAREAALPDTTCARGEIVERGNL